MYNNLIKNIMNRLPNPEIYMEIPIIIYAVRGFMELLQLRISEESLIVTVK